MAVIKNLALVPALKIDASTWFPTPAWARTAAAHASLPRTTAFAGATAAQVVCSRSASGMITPGKYYAVTVSVRAIAPQVGTMGLDWKTSGAGFISSTSGTGSDHGVVNMPASTTQRFGLVDVAPALAGRVDPVLNGLDAGGAQVTGLMIRQADTLIEAQAMLAVDLVAANYADGDSPGGVWDGADGESSSTITRAEPAGGEALLGGLSGTGLGVRTSGNEATGSAVLGGLIATSGLIPTANYDRRRGRIRISAAGFAADVVRVSVYSRPLGTRRWAPVRGGQVAVLDRALVRPIDDYEYRAGTGNEYRIDGLSSLEGQPEAVAQTVTVSVADTEAQVWLKFIPAPWTNVPVELVVDDWELSREARSTVHEISGVSPPTVVSDVHGSTRTSVRLKTTTDESLAALRKALGQGAPAYLQTPDLVPLPTMYVSIGKFTSRRWGGLESRKYITTVDVVEVAAPPPSVVPGSITWGALAETYATWSEVAEAFDTWAEVVGG